MNHNRNFDTYRKCFFILCFLLLLVVLWKYKFSNYPDEMWSLRNKNVDFTKIKQTLLVDKDKADVYHDKWIVLTTINPPTEDVKKLANIEGWKVVVVGDTKSPKDWSWSNCVHLDVEKQMTLGYETTKLLKFKSYARKSIGFLYAIQHGAKVIYETDDDNSPTTGKIGFDPDSSLTYLTYAVKGNGVVNPYSHFGQSSIWPRGYPLDKISAKPVHQYKRCKKQRALIQQGVVNGDPDVDAIYRLTRKDENINLNVQFDSKAEPVLLPEGVMAPFNSQNTLHLYDAFWGLVLPQTVAFRVCDIWRGYWAQRLLWQINGNLAFFPPNAFTVRNAHSYLEDFIDEKQLYHQSSSFVDFLIKWKNRKTLFFDQIVELTEDMAIEGFWGKEDIQLVKAWLTDLLKIGYRPPAIESSRMVCDGAVENINPDEQPSSYLGAGDKLKKFFE